MAVLDAEIVVRTEHICGNDGCVAASVLLEISPVRRIKTKKIAFSPKQGMIIFLFIYTKHQQHTCCGHRSFFLRRHSRSWSHVGARCGSVFKDLL